MAGFIFGDFSEQETEKFFGHDQQSVKVNEPEFPWATEECLSTTIEFGFDVPSVISPSAVNTGVSYPNYNSCNGSSSHQESTSSALTSPPYSSKSSSVENVKISKQSSSSSRHHSERKLKKKRPPNYYRQEYQQMLEPSTLQQQQQQLNGQKDETTPIQTRSEESIEPKSTETNVFLLPNEDSRYISCDQWVHSTMQHQQLSTQNDDDDRSSSKQSINDDEEIDSESHDTTTDTDNDTELQQSSSTTRPSYPVNINSTDRNLQIKSNSIGNAQHLNLQTNDSNIYSTSVASGASIETLKPSNNPPSPTSSSPVKQTNDPSKSKPSSWADLFRSQTQSLTTTTSSTLPSAPPSVSPPVASVPPINNKSQPTETSATTKANANTFYSRTNYHVYNSNGGESKSLEDYFSKCEVRPSAMAIKPRGLTNKHNYCYVNATLQALLACPAFFNVMKHIPLNEDPIDHQVPCIKAIHKFVNQFEKMDRSKSTSSVSTSNHKDIVCGQPFDPIDVLDEIARLRRIPIEIVQNQQEDAHELLTQLLYELHEEICSILYLNKNDVAEEISLPTTETTTTTTTTTNVNGEEKTEDWLQVGKKNRTHVLRSNELRKSLIGDIFAGKFRSTVHCAGNQKSVIHEPFFTLSLDIKDPKITTLDEALIRFCEQSNVTDYLDSKTRQQINTNKNMLIEQLPPILIIHLKCFLYDEADGTKKLMKLINYSINLTLPKSILADSAKKQPERYKLFAVEHHQGDQASKGHYITDVFHPGLQGWIRYNDAQVQVVPSNHVINPNLDKLTPYLLFYRRGD